MAGQKRRVLLVGAAGAIGRSLAPMLAEAGFAVWGTTRSKDKAAAIAAAGATPLVIDVFDAADLQTATRAIAPEIVINQLTDLPAIFEPAAMAKAMAANARLREQGTRNLMRAAALAGVKRVIAQSICWLYAAGAQPFAEDAPLDAPADPARKASVDGVRSLESQTLNTPPIAGLVLRYGQLYGPGTWNDAAKGSAPLHVDAAAHAALLAIDRGAPGLYNVAEDTGYVSTDKAKAALGFNAGFRR